MKRVALVVLKEESEKMDMTRKSCIKHGIPLIEYDPKELRGNKVLEAVSIASSIRDYSHLMFGVPGTIFFGRMSEIILSFEETKTNILIMGDVIGQYDNHDDPVYKQPNPPSKYRFFSGSFFMAERITFQKWLTANRAGWVDEVNQDDYFYLYMGSEPSRISIDHYCRVVQPITTESEPEVIRFYEGIYNKEFFTMPPVAVLGDVKLNDYNFYVE
jgi:hypothetical protein